jgi:hypothetical protein
MACNIFLHVGVTACLGKQREAWKLKEISAFRGTDRMKWVQLFDGLTEREIAAERWIPTSQRM